MAKKDEEESRGFRDRVYDRAIAAKDRAVEMRDKTSDFFKEHPLTAIAVAAGIGAAVAIGVNALMQPRKRGLWDRMRDWY